MSISHVVAVSVVGASLAWSSVAAAGEPEVVFADGTRETVKNPHMDSKGRWTAEREGHLVPLMAGDVVVVIDGDGKETVTIPELGDDKPSAATEALVARIRDKKNADWLMDTMQPLLPPSRSVHETFVAMAADADKEMRRRAVHGFAQLRTKDSVMAASAAVLAEKDKTHRKEMASVLFSVEEIFTRCDSLEAVKQGIADKDSSLRFVYAMLAPDDLEEAKAVLRGSDGVGNSDHHVRESAALELGLRGDGAGMSILTGLLSRTKIPGFDGGEALMQKLLIREQVDICKAMAKIATPAAKAALEKAKASKLQPVRDAAVAALASLAK